MEVSLGDVQRLVSAQRLPIKQVKRLLEQDAAHLLHNADADVSTPFLWRPRGWIINGSVTCWRFSACPSTIAATSICWQSLTCCPNMRGFNHLEPTRGTHQSLSREMPLRNALSRYLVHFVIILTRLRTVPTNREVIFRGLWLCGKSKS